MTGIGITLEDLGIESEHAYPARYDHAEFPKAYDFTVDLFLHRGSWQKMRDTLRTAVSAAYNGEPPLHFSMYWAATENETEDSIKASLTGLRYDQKTHTAFEVRILDWAETETDTVLIREAIADPALRRLLLVNHPGLEPQVLRDIYDLIKDEEGGAQVFIEAESEIPDDVLEVMAKLQYPANSDVLRILILRYEMTEQMLLDMVGKGVDEEILDDEACTEKVRKTIPGRHRRRTSMFDRPLTVAEEARKARANKPLTAAEQARSFQMLRKLEDDGIADYAYGAPRCAKAANGK